MLLSYFNFCRINKFGMTLNCTEGICVNFIRWCLLFQYTFTAVFVFYFFNFAIVKGKMENKDLKWISWKKLLFFFHLIYSFIWSIFFPSNKSNFFSHFFLILLPLMMIYRQPTSKSLGWSGDDDDGDEELNENRRWRGKSKRKEKTKTKTNFQNEHF